MNNGLNIRKRKNIISSGDSKKACEIKLTKLKNRLALIDSYIKDESAKTLSFGQWLNKNQMNLSKIFAPIGFDLKNDIAVSNDPENIKLSYDKCMFFNPEVGFHKPRNNDKKSSLLGMTFNKNINKYVPESNTSLYQQAMANDKHDIDLDGGFTLQDIGNLDISNSTNKFNLYKLKESLGAEYDNVDSEYYNSGDIFDSVFDFSSTEKTMKQYANECREKRRASRLHRLSFTGNPF
jgi:hypothetical protein